MPFFDMENLVTSDIVRNRSWFVGNLNISTSEIDGYIVQAHWIVLSYVSSRYNITDFTEDKFWDGTTTYSQAYKMLEKIESDLAVSYLLQQEYWIQEMNENNNWAWKEDNAMTLLLRIAEGEIRLITLAGGEFALLPLTSNRTSKGVTVSNAVNDPCFKKNDKR